jgi:hypothetical protein
MAHLYTIENFARLRHWSHIIWDIDGTITDEDGDMSQEVAAKIINLGLLGVYQSFITGRDAAWIKRKVIEKMRPFPHFPMVRDRLIFFAEVGCLMLGIDPNGKVMKTIDPQVRNHPLKTNKGRIRDELRKLAHDPEKMKRFEDGMLVDSAFDVLYDADGIGYIFDPKDRPLCYQYVWSTSKECFATFEKVRSKDGRWKDFDQNPSAEKISGAIKEKGLESDVDIEVISTAINIVPKVDGLNLGKSWAAGKALCNIWENKLGGNLDLNQIVSGTVAFGDGTADLDFTSPTFTPGIAGRVLDNSLEMIFVGGNHDLPGPENIRYKLRDNIIIRATGLGELSFNWQKDLIHLQAAKGGRVVSEVLDFLKHWDYFRPF